MKDYAIEQFPHSINLLKAIAEDKYIEVIYGFFNGGDPRDFKPDEECCTPEEINKWKEAVTLWNNTNNVKYEGSHYWIYNEVGHIVGSGTNATFGIGAYLYIAEHDPMDQSKCEHDYEEDFMNGNHCVYCGHEINLPLKE